MDPWFPFLKSWPIKRSVDPWFPILNPDRFSFPWIPDSLFWNPDRFSGPWIPLLYYKIRKYSRYMVNPRFSWTNEILGVKNGGKKWGPLFLSEYPRFWDSPEILGSRSFSYFCSVTLFDTIISYSRFSTFSFFFVLVYYSFWTCSEINIKYK